MDRMHNNIEVGIWKKSTKSANGSDCVEVCGLADGGVAVRNSKNPEAGTAIFTRSEWNAFHAGVADGELGLA
jgi:hypothetical protein